MRAFILAGFEARLEELGLALPPTPEAAANYTQGVWAGETLFLSGAIGKIKTDDEISCKDETGRGRTVEQGYQSARLCVLNHLPQARAVVGDLDRIARAVRRMG